MIALKTNFPAFKSLFLILLLCATYQFSIGQSKLTRHEIVALNKVVEPTDHFSMIGWQNKDDAIITTGKMVVASELGKGGKFLVKRTYGTAFTEFESEIKHFIYEEGYEYLIEMKTTVFKKKRKNSTHELVAVLKKEKKQSDTRLNHEMNLFENTTWKIEEYLGKPSGGSFSIVDGHVSFGTNCNSVSNVAFEVEEKPQSFTFDFSNATTTLVACFLEDGSNPYYLEESIPVEMNKVDRYEATQRTLVFYAGDKVLMRLCR